MEILHIPTLLIYIRTNSQSEFVDTWLVQSEHLASIFETLYMFKGVLPNLRKGKNWEIGLNSGDHTPCDHPLWDWGQNGIYDKASLCRLETYGSRYLNWNCSNMPSTFWNELLFHKILHTWRTRKQLFVDKRMKKVNVEFLPWTKIVIVNFVCCSPAGRGWDGLMVFRFITCVTVCNSMVGLGR